jgi:hypothetical protein
MIRYHHSIGNSCGLGVHHLLLELAHKGALLRDFGLVQHLLIEIDFLLVVVVAVILGID